MMSGPENNRRGMDGVIHGRRSQIAAYDRQLREFKLARITDSAEKADVLKMRSELSAIQGIDKGSVRRQEKARRQQPVTMTMGVAVRVS